MFYRDASGKITPKNYDRNTYFDVSTVRVENIDEVHTVLLALEKDSAACIIRGTLIDPTRTTNVRRLLHRQRETGEGPNFQDVPRHSFAIDVDKIPWPRPVNVCADPEDAARAIREALIALLPALAGATLIVQFSASAGLNELGEEWAHLAKNVIKAHVWGWSSRPVGSDELKDWLGAIEETTGRDLTDLASPVQIHYTAAPLFAGGLTDPLARRTILLRGERDVVDIPTPPPEEIETATGRVVRVAKQNRPEIYTGSNDFSGIKPTQYLIDLVREVLPGGQGKRYRRVKKVCGYAFRKGMTPADVERLGFDYQHGCFSRFWERENGAAEALRADVYRCFGKVQGDAQAKALPALIPPTYPDRGVSLSEMWTQGAAVLKQFEQQLLAGVSPQLLLQITVGAGKTHLGIKYLPALLAAANKAGRQGAAYVFVPRHELSEQTRNNIAKMHLWLKVEIWRGMKAKNPDDPRLNMCEDERLPEAAARVGLPRTTPCSVCPLMCGYKKQQSKQADVWIVAHNLAFGQKPAALPDAAIAIFDEAWFSTALSGTNGLDRIRMDIGSLLDDRTGTFPVGSYKRARLLALRQDVYPILTAHGAGQVRSEPFVLRGFTSETFTEWANLEWETAPKVDLHEGMTPDDILAAFEGIKGTGFTKLRPMLAKFLRETITAGHHASVNVTIEEGGTNLRFEWRNDFAAWIKDVPKIFLDATTDPELIRQWVPDLVTETIEVSAPHQRVRQIVGAEFSKGWLRDSSHIRELADFIVVDLSRTRGDLLFILQQVGEAALRDELRKRLGAAADRVKIAHHGNITGMNDWERVPKTTSVGRLSLNRAEAERQAEIIKGGPVIRVADADDLRWPTEPGGLRMSDGSGFAVNQPTHPDPLVAALDRSIRHGGVIQAIGRPRGVQRGPDNPVEVTVMGELALPLTVHRVERWGDAQPNRFQVAIAEAAIRGKVLCLGPDELAEARPDLFSSGDAIRTDLKRLRAKGEGNDAPPIKGGQTPIEVIYSVLTPFDGALARYRRKGKSGIAQLAHVPLEGGRAALEAIVGETSLFEWVDLPDAACAPADASQEPYKGEEGELPPAPPPCAPVDAPAAPVRPIPPWWKDGKPPPPPLPRMPSPPPWPGGPEHVSFYPLPNPDPGPPPWAVRQ